PENCENIVTNDAAGYALLICNPRKRVELTSNVKPVVGLGIGLVYFYDLKTPHSKPTPLPFKSQPLTAWHPLGGDLHISDSGAAELYLLSATHNTSSVEVFTLDSASAPTHLSHARSIVHDAIFTPNDIAVVRKDEFYLANEGWFKTGTLASVEVGLGLPLGNVIYYQNDTATDVTGSLAYPSGLALSADGNVLFVLERGIGLLHAFMRSNMSTDEPGTLYPGARARIKYYPEGVSVEKSTGDIYVAGTQKARQLFNHIRDPAAPPPPSRIYRLTLNQTLLPHNPNDAKSETPWRIYPVFEDDGGFHPAASVAAASNGRLLLGASYGASVANCGIEAFKP
ncbi:hypothetical protein BDK51DRAFT_47333, partial [Blyttiomyces helicus]